VVSYPGTWNRFSSSPKRPYRLWGPLSALFIGYRVLISAGDTEGNYTSAPPLCPDIVDSSSFTFLRIACIIENGVFSQISSIKPISGVRWREKHTSRAMFYIVRPVQRVSLLVTKEQHSHTHGACSLPVRDVSYTVFAQIVFFLISRVMFNLPFLFFSYARRCKTTQSDLMYVCPCIVV